MSWWKKLPSLSRAPIVPVLPELMDPPARGIIGHVSRWIEQLPFETSSVVESLEYTVVFSERSVNGYRPVHAGRDGLEEILDPAHYEKASWLGGTGGEPGG